MCVSTFKPGSSTLLRNLCHVRFFLECTDTKNAPATPLECTDTNSPDLQKTRGAPSLPPCRFVSTSASLLHPLQEANRRAGEIKLVAELVFEKALVAEVQPPGLVGEQHEGRRRGGRLGHVIDLHFAAD